MATTSNQRSGSSVKTLELTPEGVRMLDQTMLPAQVEYRTVTTPQAMAEAIVTMIVRGAPAIGIAGAYGVVLSARMGVQAGLSMEALKEQVRSDALMLRETRPTAVNLMWAIDRMLEVLTASAPVSMALANPSEHLLAALTQQAVSIHEEDLAACYAMGDFGATLVPKEQPNGAGILTHCNAGGLATAGYGTALGVIRSAFAKDPTIRVYADETRPRLQGARLTTWELLQDGIPVTLICEGMAASLMREGQIQMVVVGADRIAANGDTANKIGTYMLALAAHAHNVPFYVAAPCSTIDRSIADGAQIPIEHRNADEVHTLGEERLCPEGVQFYNPAFDVTPAKYISAIITEKGIACPPYNQSIAQFFE